MAFQMIDQKFYPEGNATEDFEENPTNFNDRLIEEDGFNKKQSHNFFKKLSPIN